MTSVRLDQAALRRLEDELVEPLLPVGEQVAQRAAAAAPKRTGAGAASIHAEVAEGFGGTRHVRVSWDSDHYYMIFSELGTSRMSARPFLRPALDAQYNL